MNDATIDATIAMGGPGGPVPSLATVTASSAEILSGSTLTPDATPDSTPLAPGLSALMYA